MRKKRSFLAVMGLLVGTMSFAGGTAAYLSKSAGEVKNVFTAGSVKAQLTEAHWDTQKASKVYPGQILEKDPVVKNIGENSANVFLEVNVPMRSIAVLDGSTGRKTIRIVYISGRRDEVDSSLSGENLRKQKIYLRL